MNNPRVSTIVENPGQDCSYRNWPSVKWQISFFAPTSLYDWLMEHTEHRSVIGLKVVYFENEKDALFFRLSSNHEYNRQGT